MASTSSIQTASAGCSLTSRPGTEARSSREGLHELVTELLALTKREIERGTR